MPARATPSHDRPPPSRGPTAAPSASAARRAAARRFLARALDPYPPLPPGPTGRRAGVGLALVSLLALGFTVFFVLLLVTQQNAYLTHAEDMGIMDQAFWNALHGALFHQTICDPISDANCLGDVSRFAIHFEPLNFLILPFYAVATSPHTLQFIQVAVVATGAYPAYWLASRRLRSVSAGVVFAALYLLYPPLQAAVTFDFHTVTLVAAFLMFALYFMLARKDVALVIACLLALATKEEIVVDVFMIGLSVAVLQRRQRLGLGLVALSLLWLVLELAIMHAASPIGHSPTASRYAALGNGPVQVALFLLTHPVTVLTQHILGPLHRYYLQTLLSPLAYLPLLSPGAFAIAIPALGINMLSGDVSMYSGLYQYNAEITPILIFAAIQGVAFVVWVVPLAVLRWGPALCARATRLGRAGALALRGARVWPLPVARTALLVATLAALLMGLRAQRAHGYTPLTQGFVWPQVTARDRLTSAIIQRIPPHATVSAQSDLVPHLSERRYVYLFPYRASQADYVLLDVSGASEIFPLLGYPDIYFADVMRLLTSGTDHVVVADDGILLLAHGPGPGRTSSLPFGLPASFFSFTRTTLAGVPHRLDVRFGSSLELVGYDVTPAPTLYLNQPYMVVTTYWRLTRPVARALYPAIVVVHVDGTQTDAVSPATTQWLPVRQWQPGAIMLVRTWPILMNGADTGTISIGAKVLQAVAGAGQGRALGAAPVGSAPALLDGGTLVVLARERISG